MISIPDSLRSEYSILKELRHMVELKSSTVPAETMYEQCFALDHLMAAAEDGSDEQIQRAQAHLVRAGRELYFLILTSKLDRLKALSENLLPNDLQRLQKEYERVKSITETARIAPDKITTLSEFITSLKEVDDFLMGFANVEATLMTMRSMQRQKYKYILVAIGSALVGALYILLFEWFTKH